MGEQELNPPLIIMPERSTAKSFARFRPKLIWGALAVFCFILVVAALSSVRVLDVRGASMTPGIGEGDNVLVLTRVASLSRGSVIVHRSPGGDPPMVLRRIIALPGDLVEIRKGRVFINDASIDEPYVSSQQNQREQDMTPLRVPDRTYFVMADNRDGAYDSRDWGVVAEHQIYGKVLRWH